MKTQSPVNSSAKTPVLRIACLITYCFASESPMSDAALAEIESAALALRAAIDSGALQEDDVAEACASAGSEIAKACAEGLTPSPAIDWAAFMGN